MRRIVDVLDDLAAVAKEARVDNWDGYNGLAVSVNAFNHAVKFAKLIPKGTTLPEVSADPDGHISFEWCRTPTQILSVSISKTGAIAWAMLQNDESTCG